ncbi:High affinity cGMP-specific 3',5'-cyclic phosphodiesterase 9A [Echinococcus granulosus]|nr:High affinity cGMP-specific 3',5'-cyclic phosphodiesterase 9A [Echinococcus granulosus]
MGDAAGGLCVQCCFARQSMVDESRLIDLSKKLEIRANQFEEALRRFSESLAVHQRQPNSPFASTTPPSSSSSQLTGPEIGSGRGCHSNDLPSYIPSLQPLLSNLANLRKELASLHHHHYEYQYKQYRQGCQNDSSSAAAAATGGGGGAAAAAVASAPVSRRRLAACGTVTNATAAAAAAASFLVGVERALASCDVDSPGMHTAPPPHPSLGAIRQSREACWTVWNEYYHTRHQPLSAELRKQLRQPTFNNWPYTDAQLLRFVRYFFMGDEGTTSSVLSSQCSSTMAETEMEVPVDDRLRLVQRCDIPEETLDAWLCAVYAKYNCVSFHNFKHAFMVAQMMYTSIWCADLASLFCHLDLFTLLFAAICHDLDHPGLTNAYQNNAQSRLSICYNSLSPLENHHCAVAFELVRTPATNIFVNFTAKEIEIVRENTVRCILGTDMAKHTDILEVFTAKMLEHSIDAATVAIRDVSESASSAAINGTAPTTAQLVGIFDKDDESHALTMVVLLKMCDISTEIRPVDVARPWLMGLINELSAQRDLERKSNLPLSPVMDESNLVDCQINFLSYAMLPLARSLISIIPALESCFLIPTEHQLAYHHRLAAERATPSSSAAEDTVGAKAVTQDENRHIDDENSVEGVRLGVGSIELSHAKPAIGTEGDESNGSSSTSPPLSIPSAPFTVATPRSQQSLQLCISTSNPDREPPGHALHHNHSHTCCSSGVGSGDSQQHKRTSIVSSAGLIEAELTPPHRPLRRSLGELPWSAHALLLTHFEDAYHLAPPPLPPPPPPPRCSRSMAMGEKTEPKPSS